MPIRKPRSTPTTQVVFRGDRLREVRQQRNMTQQELAQQTDVSRPQIANLELGVCEPSMSTLTLLAYALEVTTDWLLDCERQDAQVGK